MSQTVSDLSQATEMEAYLQELQTLTLRHELTDLADDSERANVIQERMQGLGADSEAAEFLRGELAFLRGDYKNALQHYLGAPGMPHSRFFCYRASAFVAEELGRHQKAVHLAGQALEMRGRDYLTLLLLERLLAEAAAEEQLAIVRERINALRQELRDGRPAPCIEPSPSVALAEQEFHELSNLFEEEEYQSMHEEPQAGAASVAEAPTESHEMQAIPIEEGMSAADELNQLAASDYAVTTNSAGQLLSDQFGLSFDAGLSLEERIRQFQRRQVDDLSLYIQRAMQRPQVQDKQFFVLHGWKSEEERRSVCKSTATSGGYFVRWNGKGVVVNPGERFLENFHAAGLHIKDIDFVVVTQDQAAALKDVEAIYELNYRVNKMDANLHIIQYYLNQQAHRQLSSTLKPHFKQERNTVHSLELYVDSPDVESLPLADGIVLEYFPTFSPEHEPDKVLNTVGLRLVLESGKFRTSVGYVSGTAYSPVLAQHLSGTEVLVTGFGSTEANDYGKVAYNDDCLGYFGTHSLIEEIAPQLLIASEFTGTDGDIRVEVAKKLRQETTYQTHSPTVVLPGDSSLTLDLETQRVRCTVTGTYVEPTQVHVVKSSEAFGSLGYLSPSCFL